MEYAVVAFPAAPVRRKPRHQSEMVNQLLFGEPVKVTKDKKDLWVKVRSLHDGYEGWMTYTLLTPVTKAIAQTPVTMVTKGLLSELTLEDTVMHIPAGSSLPRFTGATGNGLLGETAYAFPGAALSRDAVSASEALLEELTTPWLHAPYLWGGRTPLGVDCSGFVQVIYRQMGIDLPRDAWQQAQEGSPVRKIGHARPGDLLFFDNREDIVHVGILLANNRMIHASGKVKYDTISGKGIVNPDPRGRELRLRAIRRLW